jgi:hypothetical protein
VFNRTRGPISPLRRYDSEVVTDDVAPTVVGQRLPGEAASKRFDLTSGHVDQPEPLVLGGPPERT